MPSFGSACYSVFGSVADGEYFTPVGADICRICKCMAGSAVGCVNDTCPNLPDCDRYERVQEKCCEFECLEDSGFSNNSELALILSLTIGFVFLSIILVIIFYCRRRSVRREKEQQIPTPQQQTQQQPQRQAQQTQQQEERRSQQRRQAPARNQQSRTSCEQTAEVTTGSNTQPSSTSTLEPARRQAERSSRQPEVELPPPYFPPENAVPVNPKRTRRHTPPNEPPPPYDREESAV